MEASASNITLENLQGDINDNPSACGLALSISNDYKSIPGRTNLEGTVRDGDAMAKTFRKLGFRVFRKHNATFSYLIALLRKVGSDIHYPLAYKRIAFVFAGHGEDNGNLITSEGNKIGIETIVKMLSPSTSNSQLGSMARLFFIDACRGIRDDLGIMVTPRGGSPASSCTISRGGHPVERLRIPSEPNNICVAYSTVSGFRSYEISGEGGIWMQCLARKLLEVNDTVPNVLIEVNKELMNLWQKKGYAHVMNPECHQRLSEAVNLFKENEEYEKQLDEMQHKGCFSHGAQQNPCSYAWNMSPPAFKVPKKLKIPLAAKFPNQHESPHSIPHPAVPVPPCRIAHGIPQAAQTRNSEIVVGRQGDVLNPGEYRSKLNELKMNKKITKITPDLKPKQDVQFPNQQVHRCITTCVLPDGKEIVGDSVRYYQGKKSVSEEKAAEDAFEKIKQYYQRKEQLEPTMLEEPVQASKHPNEKIYKQYLHNYLAQQKKAGMAEFHCVRDGNGDFQCTVSHPSFGKVSGNKFSTKKEAENSAAWKAWIILTAKKN